MKNKKAQSQQQIDNEIEYNFLKNFKRLPERIREYTKGSFI